ncbi:Rib/alpha-like domain-containing protein, partial [Ligilactobacillus salivarius]|uniref:Rib/alpha-like domain-containing protein n=1 Tax=Ligilactobacillus salivarius TaxID=1624 RepID=UPI0009EFEF8F
MLRKENISRKKQRFSIKKISGKTVSVLIGFTILGVLSIGTPDAKADSVNNILNKTDNSLKEYINTGSSGTLAKVNEEATQTSSTTASSETKVNEKAAQTSSTTASSETKVNEEVAQTSSTTASSETKVNEEATQISSMSRFKRSLLNLNITDRNSNEVTSPTITSADRKSKIQIGGTSPKKEEDTTLVTMTLTFKSYSKNLHINNLPIQINGVDDTSEGATKFHTGIKDITLTPQGTSYVVYIVSKTTGKDDYVLTNDNVVILPTEIDDGYVAYVKSKSTGKDGSGLTSNIVVEVAEVPVLNSSANKGIIVRKNWVIPTAKNYLENVSDIPNSDTARWKTVIDTKKVGKQTDYITVTYPGAINSWTIGTNADYDSKQVNFEITDADNLRDTISASATERRTDNYLNSDSDKKSDFDEALKNATSVFSNDQSTQAQIDAATKQLTSAKEQLNGDEKKKALDTAKDEANKAIEAMPNLSKED